MSPKLPTLAPSLVLEGAATSSFCLVSHISVTVIYSLNYFEGSGTPNIWTLFRPEHGFTGRLTPQRVSMLGPLSHCGGFDDGGPLSQCFQMPGRKPLLVSYGALLATLHSLHRFFPLGPMHSPQEDWDLTRRTSSKACSPLSNGVCRYRRVQVPVGTLATSFSLQHLEFVVCHA